MMRLHKTSSHLLLLQLLLLLLCVSPTHALLDIFIASLFGYFFDGIIEDFIGPLTKYIIGGPTQFVSDVLIQTTPFLKTSIFGERFDYFVYTAFGAIVQFLFSLCLRLIEIVVQIIVEVVRAIVEKKFSLISILLQVIGIVTPGRRSLGGRSLARIEGASHIVPIFKPYDVISPFSTSNYPLTINHDINILLPHKASYIIRAIDNMSKKYSQKVNLHR